jgi:RNA polymerase sigma-54 factor
MMLAPRLLASMEILQLPIEVLQERIQLELQENPVPEQKDTKRDKEETRQE